MSKETLDQEGPRAEGSKTGREPAQSARPVCAPLRLLVGQKALVTGASSGIGKAIAIALGGAGADVVVNFHRDAEAAATVVQEIQHGGQRAYSHQADVSKEEEVMAMFARMGGEFGAIDILIN